MVFLLLREPQYYMNFNRRNALNSWISTIEYTKISFFQSRKIYRLPSVNSDIFSADLTLLRWTGSILEILVLWVRQEFVIINRLLNYLE
jgi:hypothetical protein